MRDTKAMDGADFTTDESELDGPLLFGRVLDGKGGVDPRKLKTVARLGGAFWCHTSDLFELKRP